MQTGNAFLHYMGSITKVQILEIKRTRAVILHNGRRVKAPLNMLSTDGVNTCRPTVNRKNVSSDLKEMLDEVLHDYDAIFQKMFSAAEIEKCRNATIEWNKRYTTRKLGHYDRNENHIVVSISLKNCERFVIKKTIYHEVLHIHFNCHGTVFRFYEKMYKDFDKAKSEAIKAMKAQQSSHCQIPQQIMMAYSEVDDMETGVFDGPSMEPSVTAMAHEITKPDITPWESKVKVSKEDPDYSKLLEARERLARFRNVK